MPEKRRQARVSEPNAPQDPRGMVKARLLEVQSRSGHSQPRRYGDGTHKLIRDVTVCRSDAVGGYGKPA